MIECKNTVAVLYGKSRRWLSKQENNRVIAITYIALASITLFIPYTDCSTQTTCPRTVFSCSAGFTAIGS